MLQWHARKKNVGVGEPKNQCVRVMNVHSDEGKSKTSISSSFFYLFANSANILYAYLSHLKRRYLLITVYNVESIVGNKCRSPQAVFKKRKKKIPMKCARVFFSPPTNVFAHFLTSFFLFIFFTFRLTVLT